MRSRGFRHRLRSIALVEQLGPGLVTGAADDDPSGIATYSQAGAQAGFGLLWTMVLAYPLMSAVQLVSAHIGRVTGAGLAASMAKVLPRRVVRGLVALLFVANTINIGADLAAMGDAARMMTGISAHLLTVGFALLSLGLQLFVPYRRYAVVLKWLTLALLTYFAVLFYVRVDLAAVSRGLLLPRISSGAEMATVVALFGTTISPYLFFWQSAQEVEELVERPKARPLLKAPWQAKREFRRMRFDTEFGMAFSNLVSLSIMIATAATLNARGVTDIETAADAARALEPVAGPYASLLFTIGIVGTGLLAVPVLAGSAAFAIGDSRGWKSGLEYKPWEAIGFYSVIGAATVLGIGIDWSPISPMKALFWSAVLNGVIAVPIMAAMMIVVSRRKAMGRFTASPVLLLLGWAATGMMAAAAIGMILV